MAYPIIQSKICYVKVFEYDTGLNIILPSLSCLRTLSIEGDWEGDLTLDFWLSLANLKQLEVVIFDGMESSNVASVVREIKRPMCLIVGTIQFSGLQPQDFDEIRGAIEKSSVRMIMVDRVDARTGISDGERIYADDLVERKFWNSIPKMMLKVSEG